jgi:hypothetical protein
MAAKVICPYCNKETNGPSFFTDLKEDLEIFRTLISSTPAGNPLEGLEGRTSLWATIKCSNPNCGEVFRCNKKTRETAR